MKADMLRIDTAGVSEVMSISSSKHSLYTNSELLVKGPFPMIRLVILNAAVAFTIFLTQRNYLEKWKRMNIFSV